jgi:elongation factor P
MDEREMQYLYKDAEGYHFMNQANYDQVALSDEQLGSNKDFLQESLVIKVMYFNERPIGIELPTFVVLKVTETTSAFKGDTVGGTKPATLETGAVIQVPFHIKEGDTLKVDTRDSSYVEKANK